MCGRDSIRSPAPRRRASCATSLTPCDNSRAIASEPAIAMPAKMMPPSDSHRNDQTAGASTVALGAQAMIRHPVTTENSVATRYLVPFSLMLRTPMLIAGTLSRKNGSPALTAASDEMMTLPAPSTSAAFQPGESVSRLTALAMFSAFCVSVSRYSSPVANFAGR
ncbi:hypothetical protein D9M72_384450 [compost metagenome]